MTGIRLSGPELLEARDLLDEAFDRPRFSELLLRLNKRMGRYSAPGDNDLDAVLKVLDGANKELWWRDLIRVARYAVPADPQLQEFAERHGLAPQIVDPVAAAARELTGPQLEVKVRAAQATVDIRTWRERLGMIEGRVCRIEFPPKVARGTGFLIGPDRVLTNYHVVEAVADGDFRPEKVVLRFDYLVGSDGVEVSSGMPYGLAADWLIDASRPSAQDTLADPPTDPAPDELDYALLRLATAAGADPVGGPTSDPAPTPRGWIEAAAGGYQYVRDTALYIVQHPDGKPMQIALDSAGMLGRNGNGTRVRYTTTTEPGSSGSPCFDADWGLIALHHVGDPRYPKLGAGTYNQGIPIGAIQALLTSRNLAGAFGPEPV